MDEMPRQCRALLLVGAYAGLRVGRRGSGLRRREIDPMRSRIPTTSPKRRARSVMAALSLSRLVERPTTWSIARFVKTLRRYRTVTI